MRIRRCVPALRGMLALEVRRYPGGIDRLELGRMPLAQACELKLNAEVEGFGVEVRRI